MISTDRVQQKCQSKGRVIYVISNALTINLNTVDCIILLGHGEQKQLRLFMTPHAVAESAFSSLGPAVEVLPLERITIFIAPTLMIVLSSTETLL